jgi:nitrogen-specific signal transduction histidine kinase
VGIPADQLETLFQPFHGSFGQGSGLGLAIVHRIVTDHRGEVVVESAVGRGTLVRVRLPGVCAGHVEAGQSCVAGSGQQAAGSDVAKSRGMV